jgi:hypothetical protein
MSTVGARIKEEILKKYDSLVNYANILGIREEGIHDIIKKDRMPGPKWKKRFREAGFDILYISQGIREEQLPKVEDIDSQFKATEKRLEDIKAEIERTLAKPLRNYIEILESENIAYKERETKLRKIFADKEKELIELGEMSGHKEEIEKVIKLIKGEK